MSPERLVAARALRAAGQSHTAIARALGVSPSSVGRALARDEGGPGRVPPCETRQARRRRRACDVAHSRGACSLDAAAAGPPGCRAPQRTVVTCCRPSTPTPRTCRGAAARRTVGHNLRPATAAHGLRGAGGGTPVGRSPSGSSRAPLPPRVRRLVGCRRVGDHRPSDQPRRNACPFVARSPQESSPPASAPASASAPPCRRRPRRRRPRRSPSRRSAPRARPRRCRCRPGPRSV
ncbi:hypothetical protein GC089_04595 [Cellulomonas sp. JZ18]|nr:hypothetical protein GC089_04595 [Cellulomonas sp. JZ18]